MPYADPEVKRAKDREYGTRNREARAARAKAWRRERDPEQMRAYGRKSHLKSKFGLTQEDYDAMLEAQAGGCAICGTEDTSPWDWFCIDHDHQTGTVRGLLCRSCNTAIGQVADSPEILRQAVAYLEAE